MSMQLDTNSMWTGDSLTAYPDKLKTTQDATAPTVSSRRGKTPTDAVEDADTVTISDEARKKQQESSESTTSTTASRQTSDSQEASSDGSSTDPKQSIIKQIQKVEKQLRDAQNRLAAAMADNNTSKNNKEEQPKEETQGQADGTETVNIQSLENIENPEVKMIQAEVSQLTTTLATLNGQLLKLEQKGGASGSTGSAGINEGSGLSGGMGERLPIKA